MNLLIPVLTSLTILLPQATSQNSSSFEKLSCDLQDVKDFIVNMHNDLRKNVKPSPGNMLKIEWNDEAAKLAAKWAGKCTHGHSKSHEREISTSGCGENLYMANRPHSWKKAIQAWYDEIKDFKHGEGPISPDAITGHFTQLVWYKTRYIGCAVHFCGKQSLPYYYVCHYCPAGNTKKNLKTPYEAADPCAKCTHACVNGLCTNPCTHNNVYDNCNEFWDLCEEEDEDFDFIKKDCAETCYCDDEIV